MNLKLISNLATIVKTFINSWSMRVTQTGSFVVSSDTVVSVVGNLVTATAHGALDIDSIVFTSGVYQYQEIKITEIVDANNFKIGYSFPLGSEPAAAVTFNILRPVSVTYDSSGSLSVSSGPLQFTRDGAAQLVIQDTAVAANSRPLPVIQLDVNGDPVVPVASLTIIDQPDVPFFDASSINIPSSASPPVEIVTTLAAAVKRVQWQDDMGEFIGVYIGAAGVETLLFIVGPGGSGIDVSIPIATRISIKNMQAAAITSGFATINFLG